MVRRKAMGNTESSDRKISRAVIAGLILPGLGQIYNGELFKGICFFSLFVMSPVVLFHIALLLPDNMLTAGVFLSGLLIITIYLLMVIEAARSASKSENGYLPKKYNRWYFYFAAGIFGFIFVLGATLSYTQKHIIGFYHIATGMMEPAVKSGDFVVFDKTYYSNHSPKAGDIVVFTYPDNRSELHVKRIAAMPGDTVRQNNANLVVPHGHVFVLSNNPHSIDSRIYGPIPLSEILGKGRVIYFSLSKDKGLRMERIGLQLP
jgi:signal peptidase I